MAKRFSENDTYDTPLVQDREAEDMNFSQPYEDEEVRRTNPKRYDQRHDWTILNNEKGDDSDVSNRYAGMPVSLIVCAVDKLCDEPTADGLREMQAFLHSASDSVRDAVLAHVNEQLDLLAWNRSRLASSDVVDGAIRHYVLSHVFEIPKEKR